MKKMFSCVLVLALSSMVFFASVPAATAAQTGPFYVGLYGGWVMPEDLEPDAGPDVALKDSWALGAKFGYIIPQVKWLAVELDYAYLAEQDVDVAGADGDFKASNLMVNLLARYPEGKIHPYLGVGLGWSWGEVNSSSGDASDNALAWQILAGVNFEITPQWSVDLGYRYFSAEYSFDDVDTKAANHMFLLGVNFHF